MKDLILSIHDYLTNQSWCEFISHDNIFLALDLDLLPMNIGFPCVGIKDGSIEYDNDELTTENRTAIMEVDLAIYVEIAKDDTPITGDMIYLPDGILALSSHLKASLTDNMLDIDGMESALPVRETETELTGSDFLALRKILTFQYTKLEEV